MTAVTGLAMQLESVDMSPLGEWTLMARVLGDNLGVLDAISCVRVELTMVPCTCSNKLVCIHGMQSSPCSCKVCLYCVVGFVYGDLYLKTGGPLYSDKR